MTRKCASTSVDSTRWKASWLANKKAYRIIKQYLINTDGWSWIKPYDKAEDGRSAFLALDKYYSGDGEFKKRIAYMLIMLVTHFPMLDRVSETDDGKNESQTFG